MANFMPGFDRIFSLVDPKYPEFEEAPAPENNGYVEVELWKLKIKTLHESKVRLNDQKPRAMGIILGQMSQGSIDLVRKVGEGARAIDEKDPLALVRTILSTHIGSGKTDNVLNLTTTEDSYHSMKMGYHENIEDFHRRFDAGHASYAEAARCAGKEASLPDDEMLAFHFVNKLSDRFGEYKSAVERKMVDRKKTVQEAYEAVVEFGTNKHGGAHDKPNEGRGNETNTRGAFTVRGGRGRGRGDEGRGRGRGGRGACAICHKQGHWKNECPDRRDTEEIAAAVKEQTGKTEAKAAGDKKVK